MAEYAFEQPKDGLAYMTFVDGDHFLHVVADNKIYKFKVPIHGVSRLNAETASEIRRHLHTLPNKET